MVNRVEDGWGETFETPLVQGAKVNHFWLYQFAAKMRKKHSLYHKAHLGIPKRKRRQ